jgi:DNA polymerase elongation subunit (family B)
MGGGAQGIARPTWAERGKMSLLTSAVTKNMNIIIFDIETGPLPEAELAAVMPPFDPAEVKTGNLKDPDKIAAKIAESEANYHREFFDKAALDPLTGRVVAVGMMIYESRGAKPPDFSQFESAQRPAPADGESIGRFSIIGDDDEARTLRGFLELVRGEMGRVNPLIGFNIFAFDLPFLIRRSWKHRVPVPFGLRRGRYWNEQMVDLRDGWQLGDRQARGSLDSIARHLGVGAKNGDGKAFAGLWQSDRKQAEAYLRNDVELTALVAAALGA